MNDQLMDDPTNPLDVARAIVRVSELDRRRQDLLKLIGNSYDQLRDLGDQLAVETAHVDQLRAGHHDYVRSKR